MKDEFTEKCYWGGGNYVKWNENILYQLGMTRRDIKTLSCLGLPEWAAPNIYFDHFDVSENLLKIGEDREDRDICINLNNFNVVIGGENQFINKNVELFRMALSEYAIMVESSIRISESLFVENKIPAQLVDDFMTRLKNIDELSVREGCFWHSEYMRIRSLDN
ncbi:hypothetical protein OPW19_20010 [Vibrio europaeus]|uniref:hypothetical protein n=1 Tax=Vibrio europaeus TaxID=300876 RepID=UPI00233F54D8|nr:hypothetical protein [Vibrio europaeus]MDC5822101.1 hypothetical protein [Vibrio europaeus]MDC5870052.1 hypothetical protein [Vibrio europaeus]